MIATYSQLDANETRHFLTNSLDAECFDFSDLSIPDNGENASINTLFL